MRHPTVLRILVAVVAVAWAAGLPAQTSVWKVSDGKTVVYLGGTCHVLRPQDFPLPGEFDAAFAAASALHFETDLGRMTQPDTQQLLFARGVFDDGGSLDKALDGQAWQAVEAYCTRSGMPVGQVRQFRPWLFTIMIAMIEIQKAGVTQEGVDLHFFQKSGPAGKTTHGLEDFDQHISYLTTLGAGHESEMVMSTIEDLAEIPTVINPLIDAWRKGDLATIDELMLHDLREKYPAIHQQLMVNRNQAWLPRIEELLRTPETDLVLVGVGHMAGEAGLVAGLRRRGYQVEPFVVRN